MPGRVSFKYYAPDPARLRSGRALASLVKARGFGMTPLKQETKLSQYRQLNFVLL
jgi:hypothetical protein